MTRDTLVTGASISHAQSPLRSRDDTVTQLAPGHTISHTQSPLTPESSYTRVLSEALADTQAPMYSHNHDFEIGSVGLSTFSSGRGLPIFFSCLAANLALARFWAGVCRVLFTTIGGLFGDGSKEGILVRRTCPDLSPGELKFAYFR